MLDQDYLDFIHQVKKQTGIDLSLYKEGQMKRRLTSLRSKHNFSTFSEFFFALKKDRELMEEFLDRITINVSEFFRNSNRWERLRELVIPKLIKEKKHIKCWSAACSTGEEPYTLSILLKAYFPNVTFEIIATDIDQKVLKKAEKGIYSNYSLREVSPEILKKYFNEKNGVFEVSDDVKKSVTFKQQDLLKDTYPSNVDLIICRNVLIYFTEEAKSLIYQKFNHSLNKSGFLFVGSTEQIFNPQQFGLSVDEAFFYYKS